MAAHQATPSLGFSRPRILEWVAISFSNAWKWKVKVKSLSPVGLLATTWTAGFQAPLSMGFARQEYWNGVPLPSPEEISSLSHSIVFLYFLSLLAILGNSAFKWVYLSFSPLPFTSLLFSAICKASSDNRFAFLPFFLLGMVLITASLVQGHEPPSIVLQALYQSLESISHFHCIIIRDLI